MSFIVIIDDNASILDAFKAALESDDHKVLAYSDPSEIVPLIATLAPDLIITDYQMPGMNGVELAKAAREQGYQGPIMLVTADTSFDGCPDEITLVRHKPMSVAKLCILVEQLVEPREEIR